MLCIYKNINNKYIFSKMLFFNNPKIKKIENGNLIVLDRMTLNKYSSSDYSLIKVFPNIGNNECLTKLSKVIYVVYGRNIGGAVSESVIYFIDVNKFEVVFYYYIESIFLNICPLLGNYFEISTKHTKFKFENFFKFKCRLIKFENAF